MEATLRPASNLAPANNASAATGSTGAQSTAATGRATAVRPADPDSRPVTRTPASSAPLKRGIDWNQNLQSEVARAQGSRVPVVRVPHRFSGSGYSRSRA